MITDGCRINGQVRHSILFSGVKVEAGAQVEDAVVMGSTTIKQGAAAKHCSQLRTWSSEKTQWWEPCPLTAKKAWPPLVPALKSGQRRDCLMPR